MHKLLIFAKVAALLLLLSSQALAQPTGGAMMTEDAFTPIAQGYDFVREGKYEAAKNLFSIAVKRDKFNPFALNNMAVIEEREGKLNDALANLKDASTHAAEYKQKVIQTCFAGGGLLAVKPLKEVGDQSSIAPIIQENIKKLEAKISIQPGMSDEPMGPTPSMTPVSPKKK
ncbi:MAG: tetratricopeptide repeat protein [Deltaproteobacteria bacterium]|nr:MAG: tetratricopeptide repeat protein [Deltaproteobacteria bacterium]